MAESRSFIQLRFGTRGEPPKSEIANPRKIVDTFVDDFREAKFIITVKDRETKFLEHINKFSAAFEIAEDEYQRHHPDPFDERSPFSIVPDCSLGKLQKTLSEYPEFLDEVIEDCILRATCKELQKATCRLLLLMLPGFEAQATFSIFGERIIPKLASWAGLPLDNPLSGYAAGFLGHAMESSDLVSDYRQINQRLVPIIIKRLQESVNLIRPQPTSPPFKRARHSAVEIYDDSDSRGSFTSEYDLRQQHSLLPLANPRKIVLYLKYLTPMGEYFDQLPAFMEHDALGIVLELLEFGDNIMKLETLKLLSSMLCHNKVALDFVNRGGFERLTSVNKSSRAGAAVAVCLYYLAYNGDVMERFFQVSREKMRGVVSYALDLVEVKHDSARVHSIMFFTYILLNPKNRVMLQIFDEKDGVRRIYNVISTLGVLQNGDTDDQESHAEKTSVKMASICLKRYVERHIVLKAESLGINTAMYHLESNMQSMGKKKSLYDLAERINNCTTGCFLSKMGFLRKFIHMRTIKTLLRLALRCADWTGFTGRIETIRALIDIVAICSLSFEGILQLCEPIVPENFFSNSITALRYPPRDLDKRHPSDDPRNCGLCLLLLMIEDSSEDAQFFSEDIRASGLDVLKSACNLSLRRKKSETVFSIIKNNHGIQILIGLMENPALRISATIALAGIARLDPVKQIVAKVLQPKQIVRQFFLGDSANVEDFQKALNHLSDIVGMPKYSSENWDIEKMTRRSEILKNTKILVDKKEILQLIEAHLRDEGLTKTAEALRTEAAISSLNYKSLNEFKTPRRRTSSFEECLSSQRDLSPQKATSMSPQKPAPPKIRFSNASRSQNSLTFSKSVPAIAPAKSEEIENPEILFNLTDAVRSYFREQWHAKCKNPISSCPRFSIYKKHRCPEKRPDPTPVPLPIRLRSRKIKNYRAGQRGNILDKQFVWNRFRSMPANIRTPPDQHATAVALSTNENLLIVGSLNGDILMYDTTSDHNQAAYNCCESAIINIEVKERFVTTTQRYGPHPTTLWSFPDMDIVKDFEQPGVEWGAFAKHSNRMALTYQKECVLYDVETDKALLNIPYGDLGCGYEQNRTFFGPGDDEFLSDGCLWDLRSGKNIIRFDKLNMYISGIFHPTQPHIIIGSEIWDIRMVNSGRILKKIPELGGIWPRFSPRSNVMFAANWYSDISVDINADPSQDIYELDNAVKIYDPTDYELLNTWKFESNRSKIPRRKVLDFTMNKSEKMVNVLESDMGKSVTARWYQVGMLQDDDDESDNASENSDNEYERRIRREDFDADTDTEDDEEDQESIEEEPREQRMPLNMIAPAFRPLAIRDTRVVSLRTPGEGEEIRRVEQEGQVENEPAVADDGDPDWEDFGIDNIFLQI